jgi:hypothetical protein
MRIAWSAAQARSAAYALRVGAAASMLAACNAGGQPAGPLTRLQSSTSWVSPEARRAPRLLFVSDEAANDVDIFSMPQLDLKGQITGFSEPRGLCSDTSGNIWVTNFGTRQILKLSRAGAIIETLNDPDGFPNGCAVDPSTGDLAVANIVNQALSGSGEVEIYPHGAGKPMSLDNPNQTFYDFVGYVPGSSKLNAHGVAPGELFVDGQTKNRKFILSVLVSGTTVFHTVKLKGGTIYFPGLVQWYEPGNYLAVGDARCNHVRSACIYQIKIGKTGTIVGHTSLSNHLGGPVCDLHQGVIGANGLRYVAGGDDENPCGSVSTENRWAYPAGGTPTNFNDMVVSQPFGAAISTK